MIPQACLKKVRENLYQNSRVVARFDLTGLLIERDGGVGF